jgi:hypothetical protein
VLEQALRHVATQRLAVFSIAAELPAAHQVTGHGNLIFDLRLAICDSKTSSNRKSQIGNCKSTHSFVALASASSASSSSSSGAV